MSYFLQGALAGYGIAIPVGAIAVLIVETGLRRGFRAGFAAGAGAAAADTLYASLAIIAGEALSTRSCVIDSESTLFFAHPREIRWKLLSGKVQPPGTLLGAGVVSLVAVGGAGVRVIVGVGVTKPSTVQIRMITWPISPRKPIS